MYSHSKINCFKMCPKKFYYRYIKKLYPLEEDVSNLNIGKAFHKGIELNDLSKLSKWMDEQDYFMSEQGETQKVLVSAMVEAFLKKYPQDDTIKHEVHLTGKICPASKEDDFQLYADALRETDKGYYLREYKTASIVNDTYIKKLQFNDQITRYCLVCNKILDKPILGIEYFIMKKPLIRQKKDESLQQFRDRLVEKCMEDESLQMISLTRTDEQLKQEESDLIYDISLIEKTDTFTKNLSSCECFGRACEYIDLCAGVPDAELLFNRKDDVDVTR